MHLECKLQRNPAGTKLEGFSLLVAYIVPDSVLQAARGTKDIKVFTRLWTFLTNLSGKTCSWVKQWLNRYGGNQFLSGIDSGVLSTRGNPGLLLQTRSETLIKVVAGPKKEPITAVELKGNSNKLLNIFVYIHRQRLCSALTREAPLQWLLMAAESHSFTRCWE